MAKHKSESITVDTFANRLANKTPVRVTSYTVPRNWPDFVFAFHDGEEIGPRMLRRIAKRTGLRPEDL
jgi:hypothetical protein